MDFGNDLEDNLGRIDLSFIFRGIDPPKVEGDDLVLTRKAAARNIALEVAFFAAVRVLFSKL